MQPTSQPPIKIAFASGTDELNRELIAHMRSMLPELPLWVVSDFPPEPVPGMDDVKWLRYRVNRSFRANLRYCRERLDGRRIRLAGVMLVPNVPFRRMRLLALVLSPRGFLAFNENLNHFMLRPGSVPAIARHLVWRAKNAARAMVRGARNADWAMLLRYAAARFAGALWGGFLTCSHEFRRTEGWMKGLRIPFVGQAASLRRVGNPPAPLRHEQPDFRECCGFLIRPPRSRTEPPAKAPGIAVVIPSRTGRELLSAQLPAIVAERPDQIVIVDNGSTDDTAAWLAREYPAIEVVCSDAPLSFARAVNRGIELARFSHVCLLNNDMSIEPGFFAALRRPFDRIPALFSATAQIRFPAGVRREETGKTVMAQSDPRDFPVRCDVPLPSEDESYVLYGSGGCSLYDTAKLAALGNVDEIYDPAYVEDLDLGYRAWQRGWPSVYVAGAVVEHRHRATTSRYFTEAELARILDLNYLRFLARAVVDRRVFRRLWLQALRRLMLCGGPLEAAPAIALRGRHSGSATYPESHFLALTDGSVSVFPGRPASGKPRILVASPYLPFPLSHGGAVRMYNLMHRAAAEFDLILVAFTENVTTPPAEVLAICAEVVLVRRMGSHDPPFTGRPEVVEEFDSEPFRAALEQSVRKWRPAVAQLEFTQMAQYADACAPARTILVEHDITFDLCQQLLAVNDTGEQRRDLALWRKFETAAWSKVDRVVTMSERDRRVVTGAPAIALPNGVDLERFRPSATSPEPRRLLFIGSFAHRPNVMAVEYFLNEVWPRLNGIELHVIAGSRHENFPVAANLAQPGVELDGFVSDVRPAYTRATLVIAPLVASAGTNIKVLEAMAMGKVVIATDAGVNGLDLTAGEDFVHVKTAEEMAAAIERLLADPGARTTIECAARARVVRDYDWDAIARTQATLYRELHP